MHNQMLSQADATTLLELNAENNGTLAAIWEAHQIMRDKEDHFDNLKVFLKVREQNTKAAGDLTRNNASAEKQQ
jgi:hypothetical protein